jgi:hypothetical protein
MRPCPTMMRSRHRPEPGSSARFPGNRRDLATCRPGVRRSGRRDNGDRPVAHARSAKMTLPNYREKFCAQHGAVAGGGDQRFPQPPTAPGIHQTFLLLRPARRAISAAAAGWIAVGRTTRRSEYHVMSAWRAGPSDPIMGQPIQGLTPDRSRIRPKSRPACRRHPSTRAVGAGAPPRLGKGHPSSAPRRSDPPLTELAPLSPRGRGAACPHPAGN